MEVSSFSGFILVSVQRFSFLRFSAASLAPAFQPGLGFTCEGKNGKTG